MNVCTKGNEVLICRATNSIKNGSRLNCITKQASDLSAKTRSNRLEWSVNHYSGLTYELSLYTEVNLILIDVGGQHVSASSLHADYRTEL